MKTLLRGVFPGLVGTAAMTAAQLVGVEGAPAPARVVEEAGDAIGAGHLVTMEDVPMLTNAMNWS